MNDTELLALARWLPWLAPIGLLVGVAIVYWLPKRPLWLAAYGGILTLLMMGVTR